jgi:quercetin dioxygenase-like cupin family protein
MKSLFRIAVCLLMPAFCITPTLAQDDHGVVKIATLKLGPLPVLPSCATLAPTHGDPFKGAATIAIKATSGCKIPWHWHTAGESLIFISGKGKIEMKDGNMSDTLGAGDTVYLPGKHHHQFTCVAACTFYDVTEGTFDIHYVDKDGSEIKPEDALKDSMAKPAMKK